MSHMGNIARMLREAPSKGADLVVQLMAELAGECGFEAIDSAVANMEPENRKWALKVFEETLKMAQKGERLG